MTFLNALLGFGAAAFLVPLVIHLLHRSKYQIIDWGAMHLLESSVKVNSRKMQWQHLLLLLLRCMLPILLAFAMARPLIQSWKSTGTESAVGLAIVLDDSISMQYRDAVGPKGEPSSRLAAACDTIKELLQRIPSGSSAALVLAGSSPEILEVHEPSDLMQRVSELRARKTGAGPIELDNAVRMSLEWLAGSTHTRRHLVVLSDFQNQDWDSDAPNGGSEVRDLIAQQAIPPSVQWLRVGQNAKSGSLNNVAVQSVGVMPNTLAIGQPGTINATLRNSGSTDIDGLIVSVTVNNDEIARSEVSIAANATTQLRTPWSSNKVGDYAIRVRILHEDLLDADNERAAVATIVEPIPVLLVDGDRRGEALQSESDFLRIALTPFAMIQGAQGDLFTTRVIAPHELNEQTLKGIATVGLCNVPELNGGQQQLLRSFVEQGNGLIVFLGDRVRVDQYQTWPRVSDRGLRLADLGQRKAFTPAQANPAESSNQASEERGIGFELQSNDFAPLQSLSKPALSSLASCRVEHSIPLSETDKQAVVAARYQNGDPWIVEAEIGSGRIVWFNSACDDDDGNLPTKPAFLPFMQKVFRYGTHQNARVLELRAGEPWLAKIESQTAPKSESAKDENTVSIKGPTGDVSAVPLAEKTNPALPGIREWEWSFSKTRLSGLYQASTPVGTMLAVVHGDQRRNLGTRALSGPSNETNREGDLQSLDDDRLRTLAGTWKATLATDATGLVESMRATWFGSEIWTWLLSLFVLCFLAEIALEQSLAPKRSTARVDVSTISMRRSA